MNELTKEQILAWREREQERVRQEEKAEYEGLVVSLKDRGFEIFAFPGITNDGRIGAAWGVRKIDINDF